MALRTLESNGAWIAAHKFTFVTSGIIHCMQLWLLDYCYQAKADARKVRNTLPMVIYSSSMSIKSCMEFVCDSYDVVSLMFTRFGPHMVCLCSYINSIEPI